MSGREDDPVPLATTRRTGLVDQVIEQMRKAISSGEWPVGQRIPAEPELVSALGVGRNTVREAVRALAHAGLLEVRQGDGTFVRATSELSGAVRRLVGDELREVLEVRRKPGGGGRAAGRQAPNTR
ncbi:GntR-family transcriptional regulator, partial [Kutzneria sp. 744]